MRDGQLKKGSVDVARVYALLWVYWGFVSHSVSCHFMTCYASVQVNPSLVGLQVMPSAGIVDVLGRPLNSSCFT